MSNERYLMMESDIKSLSFQLESITKSKYDSDWHSTLHTHPFTELFYVVDGKGEFNIQGQRFPVKPNDFVIINPQVEHTELSSPDEPLEYIVLGIKGLSFSNLTPVSEGGHPFSFFNLRDEQKDILRYLNAMVQEATSQSMSYELVCHNLLEILLIKILRHQHFDLEVGKQSKATKDISFIKHYLETYYHESIQLEDLASMTHLSRFYISHSFKKEIGMSPMEYLNLTFVLKKVKSYYEQPITRFSQVADIVGFTTPTYFSKQFRKSTGISPTDYREQFQGVKP